MQKAMTSDKVKHSPLPWSAFKAAPWSETTTVRDGDGNYVAEAKSESVAGQIVKSANMLPGLVEALEQMVAAFDNGLFCSDWVGTGDLKSGEIAEAEANQIVNKAKSILSKAREE